ncbi:MAG: hypothetical protein PHS54_03185 [Clostridia bacterium]|nr:hypothetical protein [Clostridia bacterium]
METKEEDLINKPKKLTIAYEKAYVKVFSFDFENSNLKEFDNASLQKFTKQGEQIIKSNEGKLNIDQEINNFNEAITNNLLNKTKCLGFVLYFRETEGGKPVSVAYFSENKQTKKYEISPVYSHKNYDDNFSKLIVQVAFDYLTELEQVKKDNEMKINITLNNKDKQILTFFEILVADSSFNGKKLETSQVEPPNENDLSELIYSKPSEFLTFEFDLSSRPLTNIIVPSDELTLAQ